MLNLTNLTKIISKIALAHDAEHHQRINTVGLISYITDLNHENLKKTYEDVEQGRYWRRIELTRDDLKKDPGLCTIMPKRTNIPDLAYNQKKIQVELTVGFPIECKNCPENYRPSKYSIDDLNQNILLSIINKLLEFHFYDVDIDGNTEKIFEHPDVIGAHLIDHGSLENLGYFNRSAATYIDTFTIGVDLNRCAKTTLEIENCEPGTQSFDWAQGIGERAGVIVANCKSCL